MATRAARGKTRPDAPDLPDELDPAPAELADGADWECVRVGPEVTVSRPAGSARPRATGVQLRETRWEQADLIGCDLSGLRARDVAFLRCNLAGAILDGAALTRVSFVDCQLTGTVLSGAHLTDVRFSGVQARQANLRMTEARYVLAENSNFGQASFYDADVSAARWFDCDLGGAEFTGATLRDVELHGSNLDGVTGLGHPGGSPLAGVVIDETQMLPLGLALLAGSGVRVRAHRS